MKSNLIQDVINIHCCVGSSIRVSTIGKSACQINITSRRFFISLEPQPEAARVTQLRTSVYFYSSHVQFIPTYAPALPGNKPVRTKNNQTEKRPTKQTDNT